MRKLELVVLNPTRYSDPITMISDYRSWYENNLSRKLEFVDRVEFHRTATVGLFLILWMCCDLIEDMRIIQSGKQLITTVYPD